MRRKLMRRQVAITPAWSHLEAAREAIADGRDYYSFSSSPRAHVFPARDLFSKAVCRMRDLIDDRALCRLTCPPRRETGPRR